MFRAGVSIEKKIFLPSVSRGAEEIEVQRLLERRQMRSSREALAALVRADGLRINARDVRQMYDGHVQFHALVLQADAYAHVDVDRSSTGGIKVEQTGYGTAPDGGRRVAVDARGVAHRRPDGVRR